MIKTSNAIAAPRHFRASIELISRTGAPLTCRTAHITESSEADAQAIAEHFARSVDGADGASGMSLDLYPISPIEVHDLEYVDVVLDSGALPFDHPAALAQGDARLH